MSIASPDGRTNARSHDQPPAAEQTRILADRYSKRATAYDSLWSPIIRPVGERLVERLALAGAKAVVDVGAGAGALLPAIRRAAPHALIVGVDRSAGMLQVAREKGADGLTMMDAQQLGLPAARFDAALAAFVLFHLPDPARCLAEMFRVLRSAGVLGTATWGVEHVPPANAIWNEELTAAGARAADLPATANRGCCDTTERMTALLHQAGFVHINCWIEPLEHRWRAGDHFDYHVRSASRIQLESLDPARQVPCLENVRRRLADQADEQHLLQGEVVLATAIKPSV